MTEFSAPTQICGTLQLCICEARPRDSGWLKLVGKPRHQGALVTDRGGVSTKDWQCLGGNRRSYCMPAGVVDRACIPRQSSPFILQAQTSDFWGAMYYKLVVGGRKPTLALYAACDERTATSAKEVCANRIRAFARAERRTRARMQTTALACTLDAEMQMHAQTITCTGSHARTHARTHTHVNARTHTHIYTHKHACKRVRASTCTHARANKHARKRARTHTKSLHAHAHTLVHA